MPILNDSLIPPAIPADACAIPVGNLIQQMIGGTQIATGVSLDNILVQDSPPGLNERGKLWFKPNPGRLYFWKNGNWVSLIYPPAESNRRMFWAGSENQLWLEDEGDAVDPDVEANVTDISGPVWMVDDTFQGRTAIGAGILPGSDPEITANQGSLYGSVALNLTEDNIPEHWHWIARNEAQVTAGAPYLGPSNTLAYIGGNLGQENYILLAHADLTAKPANVGQTSKFGVPEEDREQATVIPPSVAGFWAKRTRRKYYVAK